MAKVKIENYRKIGIIAAVVVAVVAVGTLGVWGVRALRTNMSVADALSDVSENAAVASDLRIAVIRMDAIQTEARVLKDLQSQRIRMEEKLRNELESEQKALEKEKTEIEKSQDVLSRDALQRRVVEYQNKVTALQRSLTERAQAVEVAFQKALADIQAKHLDPIIEGIIAKKKLSLVVDGRFSRIGDGIENLDITNDVISALDKKVSNIKMDTPNGL